MKTLIQVFAATLFVAVFIFPLSACAWFGASQEDPKQDPKLTQYQDPPSETEILDTVKEVILSERIRDSMLAQIKDKVLKEDIENNAVIIEEAGGVKIVHISSPRRVGEGQLVFKTVAYLPLALRSSDQKSPLEPWRFIFTINILFEYDEPTGIVTTDSRTRIFGWTDVGPGNDAGNAYYAQLIDNVKKTI